MSILRTAVIPWLLWAALLAGCARPPGEQSPPPPAEATEMSTNPPSASPTPSPAEASPGPATATTGPTSEYAPQPGDKDLQRGNVFIEDYGLKPSAGAPAQVLLSLSGNRPSPCHHLRVAVNPPDAANTIAVEVYTMQATDRACADVLRPFVADVPLGTFAPGEYTVVINAELKLTFTV